ncbi:MAG: thermonuclease family protein [Maioricimonas sp. JB045]
MSGSIRQPVSPAVLALAIMALLLVRQLIWPPRTGPRMTHALPDQVTVTSVAPDGSLIADTWGPLQLLGVQIPGASIASTQAFLVERCRERTVRLEWDRHRQSRGGTPLAFVFVDDACINEQLIEAGLARFDDRFPLRSDMQRGLQAAEDRARKAGRGLWNDQSPPADGA